MNWVDLGLILFCLCFVIIVICVVVLIIIHSLMKDKQKLDVYTKFLLKTILCSAIVGVIGFGICAKNFRLGGTL